MASVGHDITILVQNANRADRVSTERAGLYSPSHFSGFPLLPDQAAKHVKENLSKGLSTSLKSSKAEARQLKDIHLKRARVLVS